LNLSLFPSMISRRRLHCGRFSKIMQWSNLPVIGLIRPLGCASVELNLGLSQSAGRGPIELLRFHRQNGYLVRLRLPDGSFAALPSPGRSWRGRPRFLGAAVCSWSKHHGYVHKS
jgi:hypothetical protein